MKELRNFLSFIDKRRAWYCLVPKGTKVASASIKASLKRNEAYEWDANLILEETRTDFDSEGSMFFALSHLYYHGESESFPGGSVDYDMPTAAYWLLRAFINGNSKGNSKALSFFQTFVPEVFIEGFTSDEVLRTMEQAMVTFKNIPEEQAHHIVEYLIAYLETLPRMTSLVRRG